MPRRRESELARIVVATLVGAAAGYVLRVVEVTSGFLTHWQSAALVAAVALVGSVVVWGPDRTTAAGRTPERRALERRRGLGCLVLIAAVLALASGVALLTARGLEEALSETPSGPSEWLIGVVLGGAALLVVTGLVLRYRPGREAPSHPDEPDGPEGD